MPTIFSHALAATAIGAAVLPPRTGTPIYVMGMACAVIPDLDVLAFALAIPYSHALGHRGFTHSFFFALLMALLMLALSRGAPGRRARLFAYFALAGASHALLDALTNGGLGCALWWPMDAGRYFFPVTPIEVSPIGASFFSARGWTTLQSEMLWIGLPCAGVLALCRLLRKPAPP